MTLPADIPSTGFGGAERGGIRCLTRDGEADARESGGAISGKPALGVYTP